MRIFIYKLIISFLAIFFLYHSTIGYTIYKFQNKIYSSLNKKLVEDIKSKTQTLVQSSMKLGEAIYKEQQAKAGKAGTKPESQANNDKDKKDDVVDAEFEEVKDDKKDSA